MPLRAPSYGHRELRGPATSHTVNMGRRGQQTKSTFKRFDWLKDTHNPGCKRFDWLRDTCNPGCKNAEAVQRTSTVIIGVRGK